MLKIHPSVDLSTCELLIASEIDFNETLSNAPSMSKKVPKSYPSWLFCALRVRFGAFRGR